MAGPMPTTSLPGAPGGIPGGGKKSGGSSGQMENLFLGIAAIMSMLIMFFAMYGFAITTGMANLGGSGQKAERSAGGGTCPIDLTTKEIFDELDKTTDQPPKMLIPVYQAAATEFKLGPKGPSVLAAINKVETNFGRSKLPGVRSGANPWGASGPMQIGTGGAATNTWGGVQTDGNGDGKKDVYHAVDAIYGAAKYLSNPGPKNWHDSIFKYNRAEWYVQKVMNFAEQYPIEAGGGGC